MVLSQQTLSYFKKKLKYFFSTQKKGHKTDIIKMNNTNIENIGEHRKKDIDKYVKFLGFK